MWERFILLGFSLLVFSSMSNATNVVDSLKTRLENEKNDSVKSLLYHILGEEVLYNSHTEALAYFLKEKELAERLNNNVDLAYSLLGICDVYYLVGEYRKAIISVTEAISLAPKDDHILLALSNSRLASVYGSMGEDSLALVYDKISLRYNEISNDSIGIAYDYGNIAGYYLELDRYDSASYYYDLASAFLFDTTDVLYPALLTNKAIIAVGRKEYRKGLDLHFKALKIVENDSSTYDVALEENFIAEAYYGFGKIDSALYYIESSLEMCKELKNHDLYKENYHLLFKIHNSDKNYKEALKYSRLEQAYSDSIDQLNKESLISTIKAKYQLDQQSLVLESTERDNEKLSSQRFLFLLLSIVAFGLFVLSIVELILKQKEHRKNKALIARLDKANYSIRKLLSIIGHDLRGSVGSLKNFTQLMHHKLLDNESIETLITKFVPMVNSTYTLLETLLTWTGSTDEIFRPKIEQLNTKTIIDQCLEQVEHIAKTKDIHIEVEMEDISFCADKNMLLTVLRNLISNAVKFSEPSSSIKVISTRIDESVKFLVEDKGVGMTEDEMRKVLDENVAHFSEGTEGERGSGIGLSLCSDFVTKHGGVLNMSSEKGKGSQFSIVVPLQFAG